ncbi:transmembrane protein 45B-like [Chelonus insularis]|uniref:transmembrane protein 45B-like n=1 Tax=Chelonus insularis TaxID=460826 RepID=UPI00158893E5|nr:transmembrane protein 45B-like [Chelonus insularis]
MESSSESVLPYILIGCIFYIFGLKWCIEYGKLWITPKTRIESENPVPRVEQFARVCEKFFVRHPIEGGLKLICTAIGLLGTIISGLPDNDTVSPKVVHATIYLFFAFSGLVDVLAFYFRRNVLSELTNLALAQSFFVEGFLFVWATKTDESSGGMILNILAATAWTTSVIIIIEIVWSDLKLLRGFSTILHGGWLAHMVRTYPTVVTCEKVALAFSWHIAAAFGVTLCVVTITRRCQPKPVHQPQELPIYDYCNEPCHDLCN